MSSIISKLINLAGNIIGTLGVANGGTGVTTSTGTGSVVLSTSPTLVTPALGTPTSGNLSSCTSYPAATSSTAGTVTREIAWSTEASLPTITWTNSAGSNPSTVSASAYKWYQVGKLVTLTWRIVYTNGGNAITSGYFSLPNDCPTPTLWTAGGNNGYHYIGTSQLNAGLANAIFQQSMTTFLDYNDLVASTWVVGVFCSATGNGVKGWLGTVQYQTA